MKTLMNVLMGVIDVVSCVQILMVIIDAVVNLDLDLLHMTIKPAKTLTSAKIMERNCVLVNARTRMVDSNANVQMDLKRKEITAWVMIDIDSILLLLVRDFKIPF